MVLTAESGTAVGDHLADLTGQLTSIIEAGVASGAFTTADPAASARAVFHATGRFHDPGYFEVWERPDVDDDFTAVVDLLLRGCALSPRPAERRAAPGCRLRRAARRSGPGLPATAA